MMIQPPTQQRLSRLDPIWDAVAEVADPESFAGGRVLYRHVDPHSVGTGELMVSVGGVRYRVLVERVE